ncbi:hypothetical protein [Streptomyces yerevanensis]|uniref:hypothetical protein n=1 Tax=Streptomyces yerevanensis TaxID=66378 RepID=UPI000524005E|nr:hypothetical protein [Streptomyces yerevanensis]
MPYDDYDDPGSTVDTRTRQASQLDYINTYYRLRERFGVRAALGGRVRHEEREGEMCDLLQGHVSEIRALLVALGMTDEDLQTLLSGATE